MGSRFSGSKDDCVESFINPICLYKECVNISDDNALREIPMLLDRRASVWFQGVKSTINSWDEVLDGLRRTYGRVKPAHAVFRELFSKSQGNNEPTDVFVRNCRALLAQLPENPPLNEAGHDLWPSAQEYS